MIIELRNIYLSFNNDVNLSFCIDDQVIMDKLLWLYFDSVK